MNKKWMIFVLILLLNNTPISMAIAEQAKSSPSFWQSTKRTVQEFTNRRNIVLALMATAIALRSVFGAKDFVKEQEQNRERDELSGARAMTPSCPLCLQNLDDGSKPEVRTSCPANDGKIQHHRFHRDCFDRSDCARLFHICPLCQVNLLPKHKNPGNQ